MDIANVDYILDIFKALSNELPDTMLYRESEGSIELKTLESIGSSLTNVMQNDGWNLIGSRMAEVA